MSKVRLYILEFVMIFISLLFLIPTWMVFVNSFKTLPEATDFGLWFPKVIQWNNYVRVFNEGNALRSFFNGIFLATATTFLAIITTSMSGFYISRSNRKFAKISYLLIISGIIVPTSIIPIYFLMVLLHLNNTYLGLIILFLTGAQPVSIFLYAGYIKTISREMDESAIVDGCGRLRLFFQVVFPMLQPVTATIFILTFLGVWNNTDTLLYFATLKQWTMPMSTYAFFGKVVNQWNFIFADIVVTVVPLIALYAFTQSYIVEGMTAGAIKG